ncbi:hypothetical protein UFOVP1492_52 [uncultured Caudovirales phage]|uniref:Uncharacterized protein n=1 Tax=uncultured Caudovirales phage TaxID=2100421 RepID=A0A6J7XLK0_9CAUD|nr:hypothetical protein UFOVP1127_82 [uncultured Caudovirales phage]CAB4193683.1 hypothetical protein UFOVP1242_128 [uncultured Caudovirales phage]CAB4217626.1 hypothetical protein UFOVP1492_52 [uncultured Caudovirales phage]CAB5231437.1 hypothetical protein UFOVP1580_81 [uncultured Caudovirales phage]
MKRGSWSHKVQPLSETAKKIHLILDGSKKPGDRWVVNVDTDVPAALYKELIAHGLFVEFRRQRNGQYNFHKDFETPTTAELKRRIVAQVRRYLTAHGLNWRIFNSCVVDLRGYEIILTKKYFFGVTISYHLKDQYGTIHGFGPITYNFSTYLP